MAIMDALLESHAPILLHKTTLCAPHFVVSREF
jgi:hypothetical protein